MILDAVFWDSDNTLVDTGALHWGKHYNTLQEYSITLNDTHKQRIYHNNGRQNWAWLSEELGLEVDCDRYLEQIDGWYKSQLPNIKIRDGILEAIDLFKQKGVPQAVVSNGRRNSVMMALEAKDLVKNFIHIATKEDSCERKPHPGPYVDAMTAVKNKLGISLKPENCLAIEDDPKGVASAYAAGLNVIHRKVDENQKPAPHANEVVFEKDDFLNLIRQRL